MFVNLLGHNYGTMIGWTAPGNYSNRFWFNEISVLSCEAPKLQNSMMSGLSSPGQPLFTDFNIPNYLTNIKKTSLGNSNFVNMRIWYVEIENMCTNIGCGNKKKKTNQKTNK